MELQDFYIEVDDSSLTDHIMTDDYSNSKAFNDRQPLTGEVFKCVSLNYFRILCKTHPDNM